MTRGLVRAKQNKQFRGNDLPAQAAANANAGSAAGSAGGGGGKGRKDAGPADKKPTKAAEPAFEVVFKADGSKTKGGSGGSSGGGGGGTGDGPSAGKGKGPATTPSPPPAHGGATGGASSGQSLVPEKPYHTALASWSGKTPLTLLNEMCQRNQWERPQVNAVRRHVALGQSCYYAHRAVAWTGPAGHCLKFQPRGKLGFCCDVTLSKKEGKVGHVWRPSRLCCTNRSGCRDRNGLLRNDQAGTIVKTLKFSSHELYGSAQEARHHGAVFAMFSACPHIPIYRMVKRGVG